MAIPKAIADALNKQFNEELNSAYLYESMMADFLAKKLPGFAVWMTKQAEEEREHAEKILRYLDDNGERVYHAAIPAPQTEWQNPLAMIQAALKHECYISRCIHDLVRLSRKEDDIATENFLSWFVIEQVEEEAAAQNLIDKIEMVDNNSLGLYQLDKEVAMRAHGN